MSYVALFFSNFKSTLHYEHFCFQKWPFLSNRIVARFLFIFSKKIAVVFDDFSKWRVPKCGAELGKNHQIKQKFGENEENLAIFTII